MCCRHRDTRASQGLDCPLVGCAGEVVAVFLWLLHPPRRSPSAHKAPATTKGRGAPPLLSGRQRGESSGVVTSSWPVRSPHFPSRAGGLCPLVSPPSLLPP